MIIIQSTEGDLPTNNVLDWLYFHKNNNVIRLNDPTEVQKILVEKNRLLLFLNKGTLELDLNKNYSYWYRRGELTLYSNTDNVNISDFQIESENYLNNLLPSNASIRIGNYAENKIDKATQLFLLFHQG